MSLSDTGNLTFKGAVVVRKSEWYILDDVHLPVKQSICCPHKLDMGMSVMTVLPYMDTFYVVIQVDFTPKLVGLTVIEYRPRNSNDSW